MSGVQQKKTDEELALEEAEEVKEEIDKIYTAENVENLRSERQKLLLELKLGRVLIIKQQEEHEATYNYLTLENSEKAALLIELQKQLEDVTAAQTIAMKKYDTHMEQLLERQIHEEAKANDRIEDLENRLFAVKDFMKDKDDKDESLKAIQDTLDSERKTFAKNFETVEMRGVVERERLRKEFGKEVIILKKELSTQVNKKLSSKTKKALMVNIFVTKQLISQQNDAEVVKKVNDKVAARDKRLLMELQLAESNEEEIMTRLHSYHRVIQQLHELVTAERQKVDEQMEEMRLKDMRISNLEANLQKMTDQAVIVDHHNRHFHGIWQYLSKEFLKMKIITSGELSPMCDKLPGYQKQALMDKELIRLIAACVRKYPKKFRFLSKYFGGSLGSSSHSLMSLILEENDNDDLSIGTSDLDDDDRSGFSLPSMTSSLPSSSSTPNRSFAFSDEQKVKSLLDHRIISRLSGLTPDTDINNFNYNSSNINSNSNNSNNNSNNILNSQIISGLNSGISSGINTPSLNSTYNSSSQLSSSQISSQILKSSSNHLSTWDARGRKLTRNNLDEKFAHAIANEKLRASYGINNGMNNGLSGVNNGVNGHGVGVNKDDIDKSLNYNSNGNSNDSTNDNSNNGTINMNNGNDNMNNGDNGNDGNNDDDVSYNYNNGPKGHYSLDYTQDIHFQVDEDESTIDSINSEYDDNLSPGERKEREDELGIWKKTKNSPPRHNNRDYDIYYSDMNNSNNYNPQLQQLHQPQLSHQSQYKTGARPPLLSDADYNNAQSQSAKLSPTSSLLSHSNMSLAHPPHPSYPSQLTSQSTPHSLNNTQHLAHLPHATHTNNSHTNSNSNSNNNTHTHTRTNYFNGSHSNPRNTPPKPHSNTHTNPHTNTHTTHSTHSNSSSNPPPKHRSMKGVVTISAGRPGKNTVERQPLVPKYNFKSVADLLRAQSDF